MDCIKLKNEVVIRTNSVSTVLTIDAENDSIDHYGKAKEVIVEKVAMASYHEYGTIVGNITLTQGNVVVEAGSSAAAVVIDMTAGDLSSCATVKANNEANKEVPIILNATQEQWNEYSNKSNIDPEKNNIVYSVYKSGKNYVSYAATIGTKGYTSITDALDEVENGETIILQSDVTLNGNLPEKTFAINLNDKNIYSDTSVSDAGITIKHANVTFSGKGYIKSSDNNSNWGKALVYIVGSDKEADTNYTNVTFGAGIKFITKNNNSTGNNVKEYGCYAYGVTDPNHSRGLTISFAGEILDGWGTAISGNITNVNNAPTFIFEEGAVVNGTYGAGYANWIINGGTFTNYVEFCGGNIVINGGTFKTKDSSNKIVSRTSNQSSTDGGYVLAISGRSGYSKLVSCTINGGNFDGDILVVNRTDDASTILTVTNIDSYDNLYYYNSNINVPSGYKTTAFDENNFTD